MAPQRAGHHRTWYDLTLDDGSWTTVRWDIVEAENNSRLRVECTPTTFKLHIKMFASGMPPESYPPNCYGGSWMPSWPPLSGFAKRPRTESPSLTDLGSARTGAVLPALGYVRPHILSVQPLASARSSRRARRNGVQDAGGYNGRTRSLRALWSP